MQPQQPNYGTPQPEPGPEQYDFIMNYGNQKSGPKLMNNTSQTTRIVIVVAGAVILLMIVWAFIAFLSNLSSANTAPLIAIAQEQNELARISAEPVQFSASAQSTQIFASTTQLDMMTEQQLFINFLKSHGTSVSSQTLSATQNQNTDNTLKQAQTDGTYDQTFLTIARTQIATYEKSLKSAYANAKIAGEKQLLNNAYTQAQLLNQQSSQSE